MEKIKVGVLGLGSIFHRVMKGFGKSAECELYAVAARDLTRAQAEAERYGAKKAFGSYQELVECPEVDLVYIATPNSFHCEHSIMCMENGKHVICEKPFAMTADEARKMAECAKKNNVFLMEAMWTRFLPAMRKLMELLESGKYGQVRHIYGDFAFASRPNPEHRLYNPDLGGGALMDVGIYPLSVFNMIKGGEPVNIQTTCAYTETHVDARTVMQLQYADGGTAQLLCALDTPGTSRMIVYTDGGVIDVPDFWHATKLVTPDGVIEFEPENEGHHHQFDYAARYIREGIKESDIIPLDESIKIMEIMTDIRKEKGIVYPSDK